MENISLSESTYVGDLPCSVLIVVAPPKTAECIRNKNLMKFLAILCCNLRQCHLATYTLVARWNVHRHTSPLQLPPSHPMPIMRRESGERQQVENGQACGALIRSLGVPKVSELYVWSVWSPLLKHTACKCKWKPGITLKLIWVYDDLSLECIYYKKY